MHLITMLLLLGLTFVVLTFLVKGPVAFFAGRLSGWLGQNPSAQSWLNRISGVVLIGLAVRLVFERRPV